MSQIKTKFIEDSAITTAKINNLAVDSSKLAASSVTDAKVASGIDALKIGAGSVSNTEFGYLDGVTSSIQTQLGNKIETSELGVAGGVATLDGGGKVPVSQLPSSVMEFKGLFDPGTATFTDASGNAGDVWQASASGSYDAGSGAISYEIGDWAVHDGSVFQKSVNSSSVVSVNGFTGVVVLDTDDISEGSNLYFTDERAQDAIGTILVDSSSIDLTYNDGTPSISATVLPAGVDHDALLNFVANEHIDHSTVDINTNANSGLSGGGNITTSRSLLIDPTNATSVTAASSDLLLIADASDSNNLKKVTAQSIADLAAVITGNKERFVLVSGDITNQYLDLAHVAKTGSIDLIVKGGAPTLEGASDDYTVSYTGGAGGNTRITFQNDLATGGASALIAGDVVQIKYTY